MLLDGLVVCGSGVAFIGIPAVEGVFLVQLSHELVAVSLGEDAGGGDGHILCVAFDDACVGNIGFVIETVAVDKQVFGL